MTHEKEQLEALGWSAWQQDALVGLGIERALRSARVVRQERAWFWLDNGAQQLRASCSGRFKHQAALAVDFPVVGDWVLHSSEPTSTEGTVVIDALLSRRSVLLRRRVGGAPDAQPLAANVDVVLLVVGLDRELNLGFIQRSVVVAQEAGIEPLVLLNKADLCADSGERIQRVRALLPTLRVLLVSAREGQGMESVRAEIGPRRTAALMGPSGVGKSSLVNQLVGSEVMRTGNVRDGDQKGRHTTTHRQLVKLPGGGLLVDGPGVRELGVWAGSEAVGLAFPDVLEAASLCAHQQDCQHSSEPGCEVLKQVRDGRISAERLHGYRQLLDEVARSNEPRRRRGTHREPR